MSLVKYHPPSALALSHSYCTFFVVAIVLFAFSLSDLCFVT